MLSVDKNYRKRGIGASLPSLSFILTHLSADSVCTCPPFYQCYAGQRRTGGKPHPRISLIPFRSSRASPRNPLKS